MEKHSQPPPYTQNVPPYMHQQGGMGMPQPGMGMPQPGMGMPQPGMGMPQPGTGMPQPGMYPTITVPPPADPRYAYGNSVIRYQPGPGGGVTTVITTQAAMGPNSQAMVCPSCRATINTKLTYEAGTKTHLFALLLCLFGCWFCCCIPYCMDSCQNGNHYCPNCNAFLGSYSP